MTVVYPRHAFDVRPGDPQPTLFTPLASFFRRALRLPWRKQAVPADLGAAGAAAPSGDYPCCVHCTNGCPCDPCDAHRDPCDFGCNDPVLGNRTISEVRTEYDTCRARQHADLMHAGYANAVDRLRHDAGLPTAEEMYAEYFRLPQRTPGATLPYVEPLTDRGPDRPPWETGSMPVYQQACVAKVQAAERLAEAMLP